MPEAPTSDPKSFSPGIRPVRWLLPVVGFTALALALTAPLSLNPAGLARLDGDGQFSIWNVAWVAHALTTDPSTSGMPTSSIRAG